MRGGHEQVLTTFSSYGEVSPHRQAEIIKSLEASRAPTVALEDIAQKLNEFLRRGSQAPTRT